MARHVVLGAGPIGRTVTARLVADGHQVTVVTRSGTALPGADSATMAADDPRLGQVLEGAAGLVVATNPPYHRWQEEWPPILRNVVTAAELSGADVILVGNLYGYPPGVVMTAGEPLRPTHTKGAVRARMWESLLAAHRAGRVRATEIRASDYIGRQALETDNAHVGKRLVEPVLAGKTAWVVGAPDAPHSWTAVDDIAATVVAATGSDVAFGRPWIVPTQEPRTIRQVAVDIATAAGLDGARVRRIPPALLAVAGLVSPMLRETREVGYQHDAPFVCDGSDTKAQLGVAPTSWQRVIDGMVAARVAAV